jgi:ribosome biogenesis protein ENP2
MLMHQSLALQIKRKLPKVNRGLATRLLETEDTENEKRDAVEDDKTKKKSAKKKGISMQDLEDDRFKAIFTNKVL